MMLTLRLYLEELQGEWLGWIENFPGAYSQGATPYDAQRAAPGALIEYVHWLSSHAQTLPPLLSDLSSAELHVEVMETHPARSTPAGEEINAFFKPDERPVDNESLATYLSLLRAARSDMEKAVRALPPDEWETAPFGGKSVREVLRHLAEVELRHLDRLHIPVSVPNHHDLMLYLAAIRQEFERQVSACPEEKRGELFLVDGERWSLRKVLRRALWHERYHAAQVAARSNPTAYLHSLAVVDSRRHESRTYYWA